MVIVPILIVGLLLVAAVLYYLETSTNERSIVKELKDKPAVSDENEPLVADLIEQVEANHEAVSVKPENVEQPAPKMKKSSKPKVSKTAATKKTTKKSK